VARLASSRWTGGLAIFAVVQTADCGLGSDSIWARVSKKTRKEREAETGVGFIVGMACRRG
jgi:hypothetical protein